MPLHHQYLFILRFWRMKAITLLPEHLERTLLTGDLAVTCVLLVIVLLKVWCLKPTSCPFWRGMGGANRARNTPTCSWLTPSSTGDTLDSTVRKLPHDQLKKWNPWLLHLFLNRICFWPTGLVRLEATWDITLYLQGPSCDQGRDHMKMMQWFLILRHCSLTSSGAACWRNPLSPGTTLLSR